MGTRCRGRHSGPDQHLLQLRDHLGGVSGAGSAAFKPASSSLCSIPSQRLRKGIEGRLNLHNSHLALGTSRAGAAVRRCVHAVRAAHAGRLHPGVSQVPPSLCAASFADVCLCSSEHGPTDSRRHGSVAWSCERGIISTKPQEQDGVKLHDHDPYLTHQHHTEPSHSYSSDPSLVQTLIKFPISTRFEQPDRIGMSLVHTAGWPQTWWQAGRRRLGRRRPIFWAGSCHCSRPSSSTPFHQVPNGLLSSAPDITRMLDGSSEFPIR